MATDIFGDVDRIADMEDFISIIIFVSVLQVSLII